MCTSAPPTSTVSATSTSACSASRWSPTPAALADAAVRLRAADWPIRQLADHGTHLAIYITDVDGNDVELMWDRPFDEWPLDADGHAAGGIGEAFDLDALIADAG